MVNTGLTSSHTLTHFLRTRKTTRYGRCYKYLNFTQEETSAQRDYVLKWQNWSFHPGKGGPAFRLLNHRAALPRLPIT